ncbi:MAG: hypothetical protein PHS54_04540 [Clostridia bacterium]|nr:hypothetical protein [Clostridia bacterium]
MQNDKKKYIGLTVLRPEDRRRGSANQNAKQTTKPTVFKPLEDGEDYTKLLNDGFTDWLTSTYIQENKEDIV